MEASGKRSWLPPLGAVTGGWGLWSLSGGAWGDRGARLGSRGGVGVGGL